MEWRKPEPGVDPFDNCELIFPRSTGWSILLLSAGVILLVAVLIIFMSPGTPLKGLVGLITLAVAVLVLATLILISTVQGGRTGISPEGIVLLDWRRRHILLPYTHIVNMIEAIRPMRSAQEYTLTLEVRGGGGTRRLRVARFVSTAFGGAPERFVELRDAVARRAGLSTPDEEKRGLDLLTTSCFGFSAYVRHWTRTGTVPDGPDDAAG